jgi:hypothetical protein
MKKLTPLLTLLFFFAMVSSANAASFAVEAFGIDWTLTATDEVGSYTSYDVMFSLMAEIPDDLSLIMEEGETIYPLWITTAEAKIAGLQDYMLIAAPNGLSGWLDLAGPAANGCKDINDGFACAQAEAPYDGAPISSGADHTWTWVGKVSDRDAALAEDGSGLLHIGAQLQNETHRRGWIVSEPIPEPSAALVFGAGMLLASRTLRRRESR